MTPDEQGSLSARAQSCAARRIAGSNNTAAHVLSPLHYTARMSALALASSFAGVRVQARSAPRASAARAPVRVSAAAAFTKVITQTELKAKGGRAVVEVNGQASRRLLFCCACFAATEWHKHPLGTLSALQQVLLQDVAGTVYAVSNKCSHLNLSLQGKTALLSATITPDCCVVCPAHGTAFDLATGAVKGVRCAALRCAALRSARKLLSTC
jgi:nitrite reductase/ring-hydroxylating ferredoxin subunit